MHNFKVKYAIARKPSDCRETCPQLDIGEFPQHGKVIHKVIPIWG
ncbi:MAG: hypothetical protein KatS3mg050_0599 [Litorilinea sp.]|nr:MAG: hypothetical protein KatS3mg050_0599 [Litorilinea sp.]